MKKLSKAVVILLTLVMAFSALSVCAYAQYTTGEYKVTTTAGLNIRCGVSTNFSSIGAVPYGQTVQVTKVSGSWGKITYNGITGWILLDYTQKVNPNSSSNSSPSSSSNYTAVNYNVVITANSGLNMRSGAGTSYSCVAAIPCNRVVTITCESNGWGYTTYNGKSGWISLNYTRKVSSNTSPSASTSSTSSKTVRYTANVYTIIGETKITAGEIFYTWNKSGSAKSTSENLTYRYAKINNKLVDVGGTQCIGFVRYCQQMVYGVNDFANANRFLFTSYKKDLDKGLDQSVNDIKSIIVSAGAGAHLRVDYNYKNGKSKHSILVISVDNDGFYYADANYFNNNKICLGYITWSDFKEEWNNVHYTERYKG